MEALEMPLEATCQRCDSQNLAINKCLQCKHYLCEKCTEIHRQQNNITCNHELVDLDSLSTVDPHRDASVPLMCPKHKAQTLRFYCSFCETAVCITCTDIEHSVHPTVRLRDAVKQEKESIKTLLDKTYSRVPELNSALESVASVSEVLHEKYNNASANVSESFDYMIKTLEERKAFLLSELSSFHSKKQGTLAAQKQVLNNLLMNISNTCDFTEETLQNGSDTQILLVKKQIGERLLQDFNVETMPDENTYLLYHDGDIKEAMKMLPKLGAVDSCSALPHRTTAAGDGLKQCIVGREAVVTITVKDRKDRLVKVHPLLISAKITNTVSQTETKPPEIMDLANGAFDIIYCINKEGTFKLSIKIFDEHVKGSPFHVRAVAEEESSSSDRPVSCKIPRTTAVRQRTKRTPSHKSSGGSNRKSNSIEDDLLTRIGCKGRSKGEFSNPQGVCSIAKGRIIVADSNNQCIQMFNEIGAIKVRFGIRGRTAGQLQRPIGVAVMVNGNYVVTDYENKWVSLFESNGKYISRLGVGKLLGPKGVAVNTDGHIIVVDNKASSILVFQANGKLINKFGNRGTGDQNLAGPHFIAVNPENHIIVSDFHNHKIKVFSSDGTFLYCFGSNGEGNGQFNAPTGVAVDKSGNILVADWGNSRIQIFDQQGSFLSYVNTESDPLYGPQGLALTEDGLIVVADCGNHCLKVYRYIL